jgi:hypothetical protein
MPSGEEPPESLRTGLCPRIFAQKMLKRHKVYLRCPQFTVPPFWNVSVTTVMNKEKFILIYLFVDTLEISRYGFKTVVI